MTGALDLWFSDPMNLGTILCASMWFAFAYNLVLGTFEGMPWRRPPRVFWQVRAHNVETRESLYPECLDCERDAVWHETDPDVVEGYNGRGWCREHRPWPAPTPLTFRERDDMKPPVMNDSTLSIYGVPIETLVDEAERRRRGPRLIASGDVIYPKPPRSVPPPDTILE